MGDRVYRETTAAFMAGIEKEFSLLRRLAFIGAFLSAPVLGRIVDAGHASKRSLVATLAEPSHLDNDTEGLLAWLSGMAELRKELHRAEMAQIDRVSQASTRGLVLAIVTFVALGFSVSWFVPGWSWLGLAVGIVAAYSRWFAGRLLLNRWLAREIDGVGLRIQKLTSEIVRPKAKTG